MMIVKTSFRYTLLSLKIILILTGVYLAGVLLFAQYAQRLALAGEHSIDQIRLHKTGTHQAQSAVGQRVFSIVVLTGGGNRLQSGVQLLQQGVASQMLITGVSDGLSLKQILPHLSDDWSCCIDLGHQAENTLGNALETRLWLSQKIDAEQRGIRIVLVSAHYHLPRALVQFKTLMPHIDWIGFAAEPDDLPSQDWYWRLLGWRLYSIELLKFLWVKFNG